MPELYRPCKSREEAEGLTRAIRDGLGAYDCVILAETDGTYNRLIYAPRIVADQDPCAPRGEVDVTVRESRAPGRFQLYIRATHPGHMARIKAALNRRRARRIQWPPRVR